MRQRDILVWVSYGPSFQDREGFLGHRHLTMVTIRLRAWGQGTWAGEVLLGLVSSSVGSPKAAVGEGRVEQGQRESG